MRLPAVFYLIAQLMLINQAARAADSTYITQPKSVTPSVLVPVVDSNSPNCTTKADNGTSDGLLFRACFIGGTGTDNCSGTGNGDGNTSRVQTTTCPDGMVVTKLFTSGDSLPLGNHTATSMLETHITVTCCPIVYQWSSNIPTCNGTNHISYCISP